MRIAIDARELGSQPTGVGRFVAGLLDAWRVLPAAQIHQFILCAPGSAPTQWNGRLTMPAPGAGGTRWEQLTLPRQVRKAAADVLFAPAYTGPLLTPVPMVAAIYDVSFAAHPDWFGRREGARRRALTRLTAWRAVRVLTTSEFSRREIARCLGTPASKIEVIYPGARPAPAAAAPPPREPIVLYVGSLFARRNIPALVDGFARVARARRDLRLEIVGDNRTTPRIDFARLAAATGAGDRISLRSYVPEETLTGLYARASAFVFLSEYEGFGMTPLEALAGGVPIVVLDTPITREVYGEAAIYVPRPEPSLVAAAIERLLSDDDERMRILAAAGRLLPRYSWTACAQKVLDVLTAAARKRATGKPPSDFDL